MNRPRKPTKKQVNEASIEQASLHDITADQIPLDLLCDMTHRLIRYKGVESLSTLADNWGKMVEAAILTIMQTQSIRNNFALNLQIEQKRGKLAKVLGEGVRTLTDVTAKEKEIGRMNFARGCKRITGLPKKGDAEHRFYLAFPHLRFLPKMPIEHYQKNGFTLEELGVAKFELGKLSKKSLRKPYAKTGQHRRNKQGRKKKPKK